MDDDAAAAAAGMPANHGGVAQLGEHQFCKLTVVGSMPVASTPSFTEPTGLAGGHADSSASVAELALRPVEDRETPVRIGSEAPLGVDVSALVRHTSHFERMAAGAMIHGRVVWGVDMAKPGSDRTVEAKFEVMPDGSKRLVSMKDYVR